MDGNIERLPIFEWKTGLGNRVLDGSTRQPSDVCDFDHIVVTSRAYGSQIFVENVDVNRNRIPTSRFSVILTPCSQSSIVVW